ncbi:unnamed protein product [Moneuplotes crassus]|uniref:Fanconi-associated nuclease n=1 Tax=Euplotes crassus TaxID=5936 RepID=A0AAD1UB70_EUPCR|nr:unnamed protein product [Moneuplotes crassus]
MSQIFNFRNSQKDTYEVNGRHKSKRSQKTTSNSQSSLNAFMTKYTEREKNKKNVSNAITLSDDEGSKKRKGSSITQFLTRGSQGNKSDCEKSKNLGSSAFDSQHSTANTVDKSEVDDEGPTNDIDYYQYASMRRASESPDQNNPSGSNFNPSLKGQKRKFNKGGYLVSGRRKTHLFRFPMVIETNLVCRHLFMENERYLTSNVAFKTVLERDKDNRHDRNAILVAVVQQLGNLQEKKHYFGYVPKDIGYHLAPIMDLNRDYYTFNAQADLRSNKLTISIDLESKILRGHREYDVKTGSYAIKDLPGMPKKLKTSFMALNKQNKNSDTGSEYKCEDSEDSDGPNEADLPKSIADISTPDLKWLGVDESDIKKDLKEEDDRYVRNFNLVLETIKGYDFLFNQNELEIIKRYKSLGSLAKSIYVRIYFDNKHWWSSLELFKFNKNKQAVMMAIGELKRNVFIRDFNEVVEKLDYERISDAIQSLTPNQLKQFDDEVNRALRTAPKVDLGLDETQHNPFYQFKHAAEGSLKSLAVSVSKKFSECIRAIVEDCKKERRKVLPFPNFSYSTKPDIISKILGKIHYMEESGQKILKKKDVVKNTNLHQFFKMKDETPKDEASKMDQRVKLRGEVCRAFFNANEGAGISCNEVIKGFFQRCLRLFFFYSSDDTYEQLMLNDYGFYTFVRNRNYLMNKDENLYYLKPIFEKRQQWIDFDDAALLKICIEDMLKMRIRRKDLVADVIEHVCKYLLEQFDVQYDDTNKGLVLGAKLNDLFETWKNKINEIEEVISEHQRQMLEKEKIEQERLDKFASNSQEEKLSQDESQQANFELSQRTDDIPVEESPSNFKPFKLDNPVFGDTTYDDLELQKKEQELEELLEDRQSQELEENNMTRDFRGRRIPKFLERFRKKHMYTMIMADFFKCLEKGKRYDVCLIVMSQILLSDKLEDRRGYWWLRFTMNLKHLKWKQEAFDACEIALKDPETRTANRNRILKIRLKAFEDLHKKKKPKGKGRKRGRKLAGTGSINSSQASTKSGTKANKRTNKTQQKYKNAERPDFIGDDILGDLDNDCDDEKEMDQYLNDIEKQRQDFSKLKSKLDKAFKGERDGTDEGSELQSQSSFMTDCSLLYNNDYDDRDPSEILIEQERKKTLDLLIKSSDVFYDKDYYSERHIRGRRAYTGQQLRIVYMDSEGTEFVTVENLALKFYGKQGWYGLHVENTLFKTFYGLLFWDQIYFEKVPYVYQTPYHFGPLDFGLREFYQSRKSIFDDRLKIIENIKAEDLRKEIEDSYDRHLHTHNVLINWDSVKLTRERLASVSVCLGGKIIAKIVKRYLDDFKTWRIGMPDLVLWKDETRESMFVEVKSETDTVAEHQKCWISFLTQCKQKVEVCYVNDKVDGVDVF